MAAFIFSNLLLAIGFSSLYLFISHFYSPGLAVKTVWLFFAFPFSIFYRSYYTENLLLILSIWFLYFLINRRFTISAIFLSLLNITKGRLFPLNLMFVCLLFFYYRKHHTPFRHYLLPMLICMLPISIWIAFNYLSTGDPLFFSRVIDLWEPAPPFISLLKNLIVIINFPFLALHSFHSSQIDVFMLILSLILIYKCRAYLRRELWWFTFLITLFPLLVIDLMSFSRYQTLCFPLFLYVAAKLPRPAYFIVLTVMIPLLFITSLYFVNWYWVG
jgi:hypothetical protein